MQGFVGSFVDTPEVGKLRIRHDHLLVVSQEGFISHLGPSNTTEAQDMKRELIKSGGSLVEIPEGSFLLPTYTDLHQHAPQYMYAGTGLDLPLMEWLEKYTYRAEEGIDADPELARQVYTRLAKRYIEVGTGCAVMFGTIKVESNLILAKVFQEAGMRAFVGKLSMDISTRPSYKEESTSSALQAVQTYLDKFEDLMSPLPAHERIVQPILTPRFVPTCSDELLRGLAKISEERGVKVQSHMCEGKDQIEWVESTRGKPDPVVFDEAGLLKPGTIQAHVTYLDEELINLCKERELVIAHCPLSNAYFSEAQLPLREAIDAELLVGLGSDVAGGYDLSLQNNMRSAVYTARLREAKRQDEDYKHGLAARKAKTPDVSKSTSSSASDLVSSKNGATGGAHSEGLRVSWKESLYLATRGGKKALGLGGSFEVGMEFDAQKIELYQRESLGGTGALDFFTPERTNERWWNEAMEKWWCLGDERNRKGVWIQGKKVG